VRLIVFDLDHTLLTVNSSFRFGAFLYRRNFFSFWILFGCLIDYARYKWLGMPIQQLHLKTFVRLFKGRSLNTIQRHVIQFLNESLNKLLYPPVLKKLEDHQAQGDYVMILSSSPDFLVGQIAARLKVDHWKGTVYQADKNGQLIAISQFMEGEDKADYLKELLSHLKFSQLSLTVYSDSYLDLPLLKMAGQAVGVRPDHRLKKICLQNRWEIISIL